MGTAAEAFGIGLNEARRVRFWNAVTAAFCGVLPALVLIRAYPSRWHLLLVGFLIGLVWSNGFEYAYHRWILHWPKGALGKGHLLHHATLGTPYEPEHVTFGSSPFAVAMIFVVNGIPLILLDRAFDLRLAAGMLIGFAGYFIITEEVHWRIHLGGWLPPGLSAARDYHLKHHDRPDARFNVFLPIFDLLFGNLGAEVNSEHHRQPLRERALGLFRAAAEGALVYTYLIVAFILFWCSFPASARRRSEARRIQAESPKSPS
jgi:Fatty acid hydroxylase superfamily